MSPEQVQAQRVDARSDIFSFGVVLYEMLARQHPFRRDSLAATFNAILSDDAAGSLVRRPGAPAGGGRDRAAVPGEAAGGTLPGSARPGARPRGGARRRRRARPSCSEVEERSPVPRAVVVHGEGCRALLRPGGGGPGAVGADPHPQAPRGHRALGRGQDVVPARRRRPRAARGMGGARLHAGGLALPRPRAGARARAGRRRRRPSASSRASRTPRRPSTSLSPLAAVPRRGARRGGPVRGAVHPEPARGPGALRRAPGPARGRGRRPRAALAARRLPDALPRPRAARPRLLRAHAARGPRPARACGARSSSRRGSAATASRTTPSSARWSPSVEGVARRPAAARLRGRAPLGEARPRAEAPHPRGLRRDRRRRGRARPARRGHAGPDRSGAAGARARDLPQPRHRAGHARGAWTGRSCSRPSRTAARPRRCCGSSSTRGC